MLNDKPQICREPLTMAGETLQKISEAASDKSEPVKTYRDILGFMDNLDDESKVHEWATPHGYERSIPADVQYVCFEYPDSSVLRISALPSGYIASELVKI